MRVGKDQFHDAQRIERTGCLPQPIGESGSADRRPVNRSGIHHISVAVQYLETEPGHGIRVAPEQGQFIIHGQPVRRFPPGIDDHVGQPGRQDRRRSRNPANDHIMTPDSLARLHHLKREIGYIDDDVPGAKLVGQPAQAFQIGAQRVGALNGSPVDPGQRPGTRNAIGMDARQGLHIAHRCLHFGVEMRRAVNADEIRGYRLNRHDRRQGLQPAHLHQTGAQDVNIGAGIAQLHMVTGCGHLWPVRL